MEAMPPDRCAMWTVRFGWRSNTPELIRRMVAMISENSRPTERAVSKPSNCCEKLSFSAGCTNTNMPSFSASAQNGS